MIVTFQSKAAGDVIMFGDVAHHLMAIMGKEATPQGIITVEQLPDVIARLKAAVAKDKEAHGRIVAEGLEPLEEKPEGSAPQAISLTQRAVPLLELLELSMRKRVPVVWGV
jgi:hypothetical protein